MNHTIQDGGGVRRLIRGTDRSRTVKRDLDDSHEQLHSHLADFPLHRGDRPPDRPWPLLAYTFARRLKTLSDLTPYPYIRKLRTPKQDRFIVDPIHQMPRMNT